MGGIQPHPAFLPDPGAIPLGAAGQVLAIGANGLPAFGLTPVVDSTWFLTFIQVFYSAGAFTVSATLAGITAANFTHVAVGHWQLALAAAVIPNAIKAAWPNVLGFSSAPAPGGQAQTIRGGPSKTLDIYSYQFAAGAFAATDNLVVQLLMQYH